MAGTVVDNSRIRAAHISGLLIKSDVAKKVNIDPIFDEYNNQVIDVGDKVDISESDNDILKGFFDWISWSNSYVVEQWATKNGGGASEGMSEIVSKAMNKDLDDSDFVEVEGVGV